MHFRMVLMALRHVQHRNVLDVCVIRFVNTKYTGFGI